jgi:hypothetical protein
MEKSIGYVFYGGSFMKKNKLFLGMLASLLAFGLVLMGCPTDSGDSGGTATDTRATLVAGSPVSVAATAVTASVTFTGATEVTDLAAADFTVTGGSRFRG